MPTPPVTDKQSLPQSESPLDSSDGPILAIRRSRHTRPSSISIPDTGSTTSKAMHWSPLGDTSSRMALTSSRADRVARADSNTSGDTDIDIDIDTETETETDLSHHRPSSISSLSLTDSRSANAISSVTSMSASISTWARTDGKASHSADRRSAVYADCPWPVSPSKTTVDACSLPFVSRSVSASHNRASNGDPQDHEDFDSRQGKSGTGPSRATLILRRLSSGGLNKPNASIKPTPTDRFLPVFTDSGGQNSSASTPSRTQLCHRETEPKKSALKPCRPALSRQPSYTPLSTDVSARSLYSTLNSRMSSYTYSATQHPMPYNPHVQRQSVSQIPDQSSRRRRLSCSSSSKRLSRSSSWRETSKIPAAPSRFPIPRAHAALWASIALEWLENLPLDSEGQVALEEGMMKRLSEVGGELIMEMSRDLQGLEAAKGTSAAEGDKRGSGIGIGVADGVKRRSSILSFLGWGDNATTTTTPTLPLVGTVSTTTSPTGARLGCDQVLGPGSPPAPTPPRPGVLCRSDTSMSTSSRPKSRASRKSVHFEDSFVISQTSSSGIDSAKAAGGESRHSPDTLLYDAYAQMSYRSDQQRGSKAWQVIELFAEVVRPHMQGHNVEEGYEHLVSGRREVSLVEEGLYDAAKL